MYIPDSPVTSRILWNVNGKCSVILTLLAQDTTTDFSWSDIFEHLAS